MLSNKSIVLLLAALAPLLVSSFVVNGPTAARIVAKPPSSTSLGIGPLKKITNRDEYEKTVSGLMKAKGFTREQAEKEYNDYLNNPNDFALQKGEAYYKSLGYKTLMDGVIGEAEKEGRGDEVRQRIEEFKKQSQLKGLATISFFIVLFFYYKLTYVPPLPGGM